MTRCCTFTTALWLAGRLAFGGLPEPGLLLDLDAARGAGMEDGGRGSSWKNQAPGDQARDFLQRDQGRKPDGEGRPTLSKDMGLLGGKPALVFRQQELACMDEDIFDGLTTGKGHTWLAVIAPLLIWERPLAGDEQREAITSPIRDYGLGDKKAGALQLSLIRQQIPGPISYPGLAIGAPSP